MTAPAAEEEGLALAEQLLEDGQSRVSGAIARALNDAAGARVFSAEQSPDA